MKLIGSIESKITKDKNGENVRPLEIAEVVLQSWLKYMRQTLVLV